ncbi:ATP synthase F0 subunit B [Paludibaculum fermentans]|uniref:ATP synthase F0 subunit B n=1 Tax=Paludibaculum fermentans TaxID=1473598 RepID=A0A7S7SIN2_PALFE|nr:ATP synthase F0 subunit B [Paludibaculum fermentans]QOY86274.1 ATP synthase F0 subunit B [Paludibaculum fermentans]
MEQIFETLKGIIVRALPTFALVILLHWFLKKVLFQPMEKVLEERRKKTEGAVEASEATLALVNEKLATYENSLADARAEIYKEQEAGRKRLADQQAKAVEAARIKAGERVAAVKAELALEVDKATATLAAESDRLAEEIAGLVLAGKVQ